jgi:hypothetical protein
VEEARNRLHKFDRILLGQPMPCLGDRGESDILCKLLGLRLEPLTDSAT